MTDDDTNDSTTIENTINGKINAENDEENEENNNIKDTNDLKMQVKKSKKQPGVVYLSRIPTKMNVKLIRDYFSDFGTVGRIFLQPEEKKRKHKTIRMFTEGWVEFKNKKIAKLVAKKLNNQAVGGKKRNPWYEELWNIKYLKNFRWTHLNERLAYENESRKQRLRQEISLAKKEANFYIQNFEKGEKLKRLEKKLKNKEGQTKDAENNNSELSLYKNTKITNEDESSDNNSNNNKRPKFERKVKVTNNEDFLKLIFSK